MRVKTNHWQLVEMTPAFWSSSKKELTTLSAHCSGVPDQKQASKVMVAPVVVSACRERLQPGESELFSALQQSVQIQTSGRYSSILALTLSFTWLRILVDILLPAQVPLTLLIYPFSSKLILLNFLTAGMMMCTWPPPFGRYPLLTIFIANSLSSWQWVLRNGMSWFWIVSTELSVGWLVRPWRWMFRAVFPVKAINNKYQRQYAIDLQSPQSKCSYTPSLLVTIPAQNFSRVPPLVTMTLQPLLTASIICKKRDYSGSNPGGWLWRLMSSKTKFCQATKAQRSCCLNTRGSLLTIIVQQANYNTKQSIWIVQDQLQRIKVRSDLTL